MDERGKMIISTDALIKPSTRVDRLPPQNLRSENQELFEDAFEYKTNDTYLRSFGAVRVSPDSVVYKGGRLIDETVVENEQKSYYRLRHLAKKFLTGKRVDLAATEKFLLVTDAWSAGHFHWFMEVLPRLWLVKERAQEFVLLLPDTDYVRKIGLDSIELLAFRFKDIAWMKEAEFYKAPDLYYVSNIAAPGQVNDEVMRQINLAFVGKCTDETEQKKIYISRDKARVRKVLNEDELTALLRDHGFEILHGEDHSLAEHVEIFAKCSTLIGIHGAGLTNCIFMKPGGNVVELRKREKNYGYWHLAGSLGHKYYYYDGIPDSEQSLIGRGCNLTVPVADFENEILSKF